MDKILKSSNSFSNIPYVCTHIFWHWPVLTCCIMLKCNEHQLRKYQDKTFLRGNIPHGLGFCSLLFYSFIRCFCCCCCCGDNTKKKMDAFQKWLFWRDLTCVCALFPCPYAIVIDFSSEFPSKFYKQLDFNKAQCSEQWRKCCQLTLDWMSILYTVRNDSTCCGQPLGEDPLSSLFVFKSFFLCASW